MSLRIITPDSSPRRSRRHRDDPRNTLPVEPIAVTTIGGPELVVALPSTTPDVGACSGDPEDGAGLTEVRGHCRASRGGVVGGDRRSVEQPVNPKKFALSSVRYSVATPASQMTARASAGQFAPVTRRLLISWLFCVPAFGVDAPPELYQLSRMTLSLVVPRVLYAFVKTHGLAPCSTLSGTSCSAFLHRGRVRHRRRCTGSSARTRCRG